MDDSLEQLHAREMALIAQRPDRGVLEERGQVVDRLELPRQWRAILDSYVRLLDDANCQAEALRRALFLVWYSYNEPPALSGLGDVAEDVVITVLGHVEAQLRSRSPDGELLLMLAGYGDGLPFDLYGQFAMTRAAAREPAPAFIAGAFENLASRGAMGDYWLSRPDRPGRPDFRKESNG